ncbi:MAG: ABC transporter ATP-binding protein [Arcobacteraceae bacterium]|nr:ABC transporter ATP-binding protein [Arcobacteraceae bacterium]
MDRVDNKFIQIKNITKIFNPNSDIEVIGLKDINIELNKGEFVVLSGPSGSGKTTLLNLIGGLDGPSMGEVILDNINISYLDEDKLSDERRDNIGFVFQAYNLVPVLTAKENIEYIMKLQGKSQENCDKRVLEIAKKLDIESILYKLPSHLSGGQQQRVAVARAVATKPKLILADEPTANLDSVSAGELMDMMERLNEEENITIIFSSHDPMVIAKAKRSIILKDGKVFKNEIIS